MADSSRALGASCPVLWCNSSKAPMQVLGMESPLNTSARSPINLALPWGNAFVQIAKLIYTDWVYYTHTLEAYAPNPDLSVIACRPSTAEKSAEEQPSNLPQKNVSNSRVLISISSGSY